MISLQESGVETRLKRWNSNRFGFRNVTCKDTPSFKQRGIDGIIISVVICSNFQTELSEEDGYRNVSSGLSVGTACSASCWGLAKLITPCNQQRQHRTPTTQMTDPLVGTPTSTHFVPPEPNAIFCMVFCWSLWIDCRGESHGL
jgi:hypothetical protein